MSQDSLKDYTTQTLTCKSCYSLECMIDRFNVIFRRNAENRDR